MLQMQIQKIEEDLLASSLRRQKNELQEIIDAIERRDIELEQVLLSVGLIATSLSQIRKHVSFKVA